MNIHEYQAKQILATYGLPVARGYAIPSRHEAPVVLKTLLDDGAWDTTHGRGGSWVVKAQIHAGGRGKAGGIRVAKSHKELASHVNALLGARLVTPQTGEQGKVVKRLYIEEGLTIIREFYLSMVIDRARSCVGIITSTEGGTDIEDVAARSPEKIHRLWVDPASGFQPHHGREVAYCLLQDLKAAGALDAPTITSIANQISQVVASCYQAFMDLDASLIEINPLAITVTDDAALPAQAAAQVLALDVKMSFDDNALYRHPDVASLRDVTEENPTEQAANELGLSYIKLDGSIGCLVNGAGLAMATMDIIKLYGAQYDIHPANFLDVGGGASQEKVTEAFKIILSDPNVKGVLVCIFGGIMRCDVIAQGIINALAGVKLKVPLVVRLEGTNVDEGRRLLHQASLPLQTAATLDEAAELIVAAVRSAPSHSTQLEGTS